MEGQTSTPEPVPGESRHRLEPGERFGITEHDTSSTGPYGSREEAAEDLERLLGRLAELTDRLAAEGERALLVVLQGFDGAGKDVVITNVMGAVDPAAMHVFSFNTPVGDEAEHDFLWRFHQQTPARGRVHVFDRSYYEEVIAARVHGVIDEDACRARYDSIDDFERILARDATVILKFFLHVSKDVQADRVRERLNHRAKQGEFSAADVTDRELWDEHDRAYEDALTATNTEYAPWHAVPSDHRWYACVAVADALVSTLEALDPQYPPLDEEEVREAGLDPDEVMSASERS
jgi:PPK2 family polyphosphate:nucleotide phosphotransferase